MGGTDLTDALAHIDPSKCDYQEWVNVGMALKHEGYSCGTWDGWSAGDRERYKEGECEKKWATFHGSALPVTGGTVYELARKQGWEPQHGYELAWDGTITENSEGIVVSQGWVEDQEIEEPASWDPVLQIIEYLEALFEAGDNVGYVMQSYQKDDGKYVPRSAGNYDRTAGQLIEELSRRLKDKSYSEERNPEEKEEKARKIIGETLGDYEPEAGAWIRFNPLDGRGARNANVADFRYALVESDNMEIGRQNAIIRELELPVAALVYTGNKSLHAITRVDAADAGEYRKRVEYLYNVCEKNGMTLDKQNKNPSRLSRLPGVTRGGRKQFIVARNIGRKDWNEWYEWIEGVNDNLPDVDNLGDVWDSVPPLAGELIAGVLRKGHKMLVSGPPKAGKSLLLIELCIAIAEGGSWLRWKCAKGRVFYVNLEVDRPSCLNRLKDAYAALGIPPDNARNIDVWSLRGRSVPMDRLAPKLIRRAQKKGYAAVVIDPIYKVITGDENSAEQMARFCNQFDKICAELGCAVVYCHHHSKGLQGQKRSMDRASGSGVFARDPDAQLDMIQLETTEALMEQEANKAMCAAIRAHLERGQSPAWDWKGEISQDDWLNSKTLLAICENRLDRERGFPALKEAAELAASSAKRRTAWRIEGILREFPPFPPVNVWFDYPVHRPDETGSLGDVAPEEEKPYWQKKSENRKKQAEKERSDNNNAFRVAFEGLLEEGGNGCVRLSDIAEQIGVAEDTAKRWFYEGKKSNKELKRDYTKTITDGVVYIKKKEKENGKTE